MLIGRLLNDRYELLKIIGGGGMANVYLAKDTILNRKVAIKILRLEYANDEEFITRFDREAKAATSLNHPNIVSIYDVGEEENILYMVMEHVDGLTLKEYIQRFGPIEVDEALRIMKKITSAIGHAHHNNLVHRDIKPQNILMDQKGNVKVTDFGIAIALSATSLTETNSILGSVHYLSPEQARGGMATKKSDVYSLGIVFYELLTGQLPFTGQTPVSIALKHLQNEMPSVKRFNPEVPQSIENIVLKATAKDPFHRYETIHDLKEALDVALHPDNIDEPLFTPPVEPGEETKMIPVITGDLLGESLDDDTILHQAKAQHNLEETDTEDNLEEAEEENTKNKKMSKRKKRRVISFAVLAGLVIFLLAIFVIPGMFKPSELEIPSVTDLAFDQARDKLEELDFNVEKEFVYSDEVEEDYVVKTYPKAGEVVEVESLITLYVSQGKKTEEFKNFSGKQFSQTRSILEEEGYKEVIKWDVFSDKPVGEIISHVQPDSGEDVVPEDTRVIFEVSSGPELISLGNLEGMTESEAKDYLNSKQLVMSKREDYSDTVPVGKVITHEPESNTELAKGSVINVIISVGPKKEPPIFHSVTFTVPYKERSSLTNENDGDDMIIDTEPSESSDQEGTEKREKQKVLIYIDDKKHNIEDVFKEDFITEDTQYTITLTIDPDSEAHYKVLRDDDVVIDETKSY